MKRVLDGNAIVYCDGAFNTPSGKTAHGLVRFTERYHVLSVIDSNYTGSDAGEVLDGKESGIPIFPNLEVAYNAALTLGQQPHYFVIGLAPDGGQLPEKARKAAMDVINLELNIVSGLHD
ncbi:MAG: DUF1611 domain-containing protein [Bacteroidota bacterium]